MGARPQQRPAPGRDELGSGFQPQFSMPQGPSFYSHPQCPTAELSKLDLSPSPAGGSSTPAPPVLQG